MTATKRGGGDDSEPIIVTHKNGIGSMMTDGVTFLNFKMCFLLMIFYILLNSDVFIERVLGKFSGSVEMRHVTSYGTVLQSMFLAMGYIVADILINNSII